MYVCMYIKQMKDTDTQVKEAKNNCISKRFCTEQKSNPNILNTIFLISGAFTASVS